MMRLMVSAVGGAAAFAVSRRWLAKRSHRTSPEPATEPIEEEVLADALVSELKLDDGGKHRKE